MPSVLKRLFEPTSRPTAARPALAPAGRRLYAVGDIHGRLDLLDALLAILAADAAEARRAGEAPEIVFLGDYVDRGPDSRAVLDRLSGGDLGVDLPYRCLLGNHEQAMMNFLRDPVGWASWLNFGAVECLAGYGVAAAAGLTDPTACTAVRDAFRAALPDAHLAFLDGLDVLAVAGDYAFVHAGVRPGRPLDAQAPDDLLWIREPFLSHGGAHDKVIVHGHSITDVPVLRANRIGLDTGAFASGVLTAVALHGPERRVLQARL